MTDDVLIDILVDTYSAEYRIYSSLLDGLKGGMARLNASPDLAPIIPLLEARNKDFDSIKKLDASIASEKSEWEKRGGGIHTIRAETLRTLLGNIRTVLSDVLETNKQLENRLSGIVGKK